VTPYDGSGADRAFLGYQLAALGQWHADVDDGFVAAMIAAHERGRDGTRLDFQEKCAVILVARQAGRSIGLTIATRKRGGALKAYPLFGSRAAQRALLLALEQIAARNLCHKLYTYCHATDAMQRDWLTGTGFRACGLIQAPYKRGHDLLLMERALVGLGVVYSPAPMGAGVAGQGSQRVEGENA